MTLNIYKSLILVALSFIVLSIIGCLSYLKYFDNCIIDAFFEAVSGYTTTGFTLLNDLDELPRSMLIWRAQTQWIGGLGIIVFFLFLVSRIFMSSKSEITEVEKINKTLARVETSMLAYGRMTKPHLAQTTQQSCLKC